MGFQCSYISWPLSSWAVLGGFLGFLETPWGSPRFFPSFYSLQNVCGHMFTQCGFQQACQWILTTAGLQIQSRSTRKAKADPGNGCFDAQLYTLASCMQQPCQPQHKVMIFYSVLLLSNYLPQIALEALSEHKFSGACPQTPSYIPFPTFFNSVLDLHTPENSNS